MAKSVEVDPRGLFTGQVSEATVDAVLRQVEQDVPTGGHRWEEGDRPQRTTVNYGWSFVALERGEKKWIDIPEPVKLLQQELFGMFHEASADTRAGRFFKPEDLDNIIISIYEPGDSIVPHYDRAEDPRKPYHFGDSVFGVVLLPTASRTGIFWQRNEDFPGQSLTMDLIKPEVKPEETKGFAFMMQSEIRNWPFYHGVIPSETRRISVTVRATVFKQDREMAVVA